MYMLSESEMDAAKRAEREKKEWMGLLDKLAEAGDFQIDDPKRQAQCKRCRGGWFGPAQAYLHLTECAVCARTICAKNCPLPPGWVLAADEDGAIDYCPRCAERAIVRDHHATTATAQPQQPPPTPVVQKYYLVLETTVEEPQDALRLRCTVS
jgi:predicted RNA-binding Zn-ribbon protein involved in translation (DUF1610 family)